jgi:glucose-1-phosphate thymidylyltransferase
LRAPFHASIFKYPSFNTIREFLVITTPRDQTAFRELLGTGTHWGIKIDYAVQPEPNGIAHALIIARSFLAGAPAALILRDNIFPGANLSSLLQSASARTHCATVFGYYVATANICCA